MTPIQFTEMVARLSTPLEMEAEERTPDHDETMQTLVVMAREIVALPALPGENKELIARLVSAADAARDAGRVQEHFLFRAAASDLEAADAKVAGLELEIRIATREASKLATVLAKKHYPDNTVWEASSSLIVLISQIDDATTGMSRASTLAAENERMREALEKIAANLRMARAYLNHDREIDGERDYETGDQHVEAALVRARAALTAPAPGGERNVCDDGWKLVPVEPTWEMQIAGRDAILAEDDSLDLSTDDARAAYLAMLAALPASPRNGGE